jgi:hypothetical protein
VVVVGGYVYRGNFVQALTGKYVFGDFSKTLDAPNGSIFTATVSSGTGWSFSELTFSELTGGRLGDYLLGFGEDLDGELYVLTTHNLGPT